MKISKVKFIRKYGADVKVKRYDSGVLYEYDTKALLGRGSRTNSMMRQLETLREGIFLPDDDIKSGYLVESLTTQEVYIVGGTFNEIEKNQVVSIVANLLLCNSRMTIKGHRYVADIRGNLKTSFVEVCSDLPCHLQEVNNDLRQFDPGLLPTTEYLVYSTAIDVSETDQLLLKVRDKQETFKILSKDYVTFPNLVVIQVARDIRK